MDRLQTCVQADSEMSNIVRVLIVQMYSTSMVDTLSYDSSFSGEVIKCNSGFCYEQTVNITAEQMRHEIRLSSVLGGKLCLPNEVKPSMSS